MAAPQEKLLYTVEQCLEMERASEFEFRLIGPVFGQRRQR